MRKRLRSSIKWSCTALTVLLLVVWIGSAWWGCGGKLLPTGELFIGGGALNFGWNRPWSIIPNQLEWWGFFPTAYDFVWSFDVFRGTTFGGATNTFVTVPLWSLLLPFAALNGWLWYRDRPRKPGHCVICNYNLRANTTGVCPECGNRT